jgi:hypothetical protein
MTSFTLHVETVGRSCDGCTKCCEGWLTADIYGFPMGPEEGSCKFLSKFGCGIYPVRETLCKNFQCDWKENYLIPQNMKPDKSNVILLAKRLKNFVYRRLVTAGTPIKDYVYEWVENESVKGNHFVGYDAIGQFKIWSQNKNFINLLEEHYKVIKV